MIVIIDTSVFVSVLGLPAFRGEQEYALEELSYLIDRSATLFVPVSVLYETGNFIGYIRDGNERRRWAGELSGQVELMISGEAPWAPLHFQSPGEFGELISGFPENALAGCSLTDHTILKDWQRLRELNTGRDIFIWSLDAHLSGYYLPGRLT